jgi:hydroxyacylglutathione hydrolase
MSGLRVDLLTAGFEPHTPVEHKDPGPFVYLMIAECLPGIEPDQHGARLVFGVHDHRGPDPTRRLDVAQVPRLHRRKCTTARLDSRVVSLVVDRYEVGPVGTNCYVVRAERGATEGVVIDPGGDAAELLLELARIGVRCAAILVTHADADHVAGLADLAEGTGAPVYAPPRELMPAERASGWLTVRDYDVDTELTGGETLNAAGITFEVVAIPGHSPDHIAFYADGHLFSGDLIFAGSVGRVDLAGGDWQALLASARLLNERYAPETTVYPGHGPMTTLGTERESNPFLAELRA